MALMALLRQMRCATDRRPGSSQRCLQRGACGAGCGAVGQGLGYGADPVARMVHPGRDVAQACNREASTALDDLDVDQETVLGGSGAAGGRLAGQQVAHAEGDPLPTDALDRLHDMDVVTQEQVDVRVGE